MKILPSSLWVSAFSRQYPGMRVISLFAAALAVAVVTWMTPGTASAESEGGEPEPAFETAAEALAAEIARDPRGEVIGNTIVRPDGTVFVAVDSDVYSLSQCSSGRFCVWAQTNFTGSFQSKSGSGVTRNLTGTTKSAWNNRGKAARLYNNTESASTCYAPGDQDSSLPASYHAASKVYLASGSAC